jgi:hypothetical protein
MAGKISGIHHVTAIAGEPAMAGMRRNCLLAETPS